MAGRSRPPTEYMEKLRSRKAEVGEQLDAPGPRPGSRQPPLGPRSVDEPLLGPRPARVEPARDAPANAPDLAPYGPKPDQPESYTNRLLRAKQKVWEEREKEQAG